MARDPFTAGPPGPNAPGLPAQIADYALIGDGRSAALVSRTGSVDWLCLPHFSSPSLFAALLDPERGGHFSLQPAVPFRVERRYRSESAVLETTFITRHGAVRLLDLLPLAGGRDQLEPQRSLLRLMEGIGGKVEMELHFQPRPDYGRSGYVMRRRGALGIACEFPGGVCLLATDAGPLHHTAQEATARFMLRARERRSVVLAFASDSPVVVPSLGEGAWNQARATESWWQAWSGRCAFRGRHWGPVIRSMVTLKQLTNALSGAVLAAPTASLPENPGGTRNWDYRYCWLRDASRTLEAFQYMGYSGEARNFLGWLLHATRLTHPELRVLYTAYGEDRTPEFTLPRFSGYGGARPVRIGNAAWDQLQLDVYGEVVAGAYSYVQHGGNLDLWEKQYLVGFGEVICRRWREPDNGMWEIRGTRRHYTYSKLMCWVVLQRLLLLHEQGHLRVPEALYRRELAAIREAIESRGFNRRLNSYVGVFDDDWLDASLLLMPHHGYIRGDDPRMLATYQCLRKRLGVGRLLYRYRPGSDNIEEPEGAFAACSFWAVDCLAHAGRIDEAESELDYLVSLANDVGLYGEEFDRDGAPLGNFPQAFSHAGLITAAIAIEQARDGRLPWR